MRTLAQIRAASALLRKDLVGAGQRGGDAISGFPTMIATNGLLAALAFACEPKGPNDRKHKGEFSIASAIAMHLSCDGVGITEAGDADALVDELAKAEDAAQLRRATAEALAYLNYLKRFVA
jgi:CRISPR/Cas system CMR-associated protein Cmr5 small subunit